MRKLLLITLAFIMLLLIGTNCSGGGDPEPRDLSGLEGTWEFTATVDGTLDGDDGFEYEIHNTFQSTLIITQTQVREGSEIFIWEYDGSTLLLSISGSETYWDDTCGDSQDTWEIHYSIKITPDSDSGIITGTADVIWLSDNCVNLSGTLFYNGNFTRN